MELAKKTYIEAYKKFGKSNASILIPKGRQEERFKLLTQFFKKENFSVLDFGCGFGDLRSFLQKNHSNFEYLGVDIIKEFIEENKKISKNEFLLIKEVTDIPKKKFDYICISGTFNVLYYDSLEKHEAKVYEILKYLFENHLNDDGILSVDFMHDEVDYIQEKAYHINIPKMYNFIVDNLSKRLVINKHIFCYEVTFNIFKNTTKNRVNLYSDYKNILK